MTGVAGGELLTVTVTVDSFVESHPAPSITVKEYVVVSDGDALGVKLFGSSSPAEGDQAQETPPDPKSCVALPKQIVVDPRATAAGPEQTKLKPEGRLADFRSGFVTATATVPAECAGVTALIVEAEK